MTHDEGPHTPDAPVPPPLNDLPRRLQMLRALNTAQSAILGVPTIIAVLLLLWAQPSELDGMMGAFVIATVTYAIGAGLHRRIVLMMHMLRPIGRGWAITIPWCIIAVTLLCIIGIHTVPPGDTDALTSFVLSIITTIMDILILLPLLAYTAIAIITTRVLSRQDIRSLFVEPSW